SSITPRRLSSQSRTSTISFLPPSPRILSPPFFFFFNDPATTEIYTLSLHDALPIYLTRGSEAQLPEEHEGVDDDDRHHHPGPGRSEEHTSELQSLTNLVCRLLLEKKKDESDRTNRHTDTSPKHEQYRAEERLQPEDD